MHTKKEGIWASIEPKNGKLKVIAEAIRAVDRLGRKSRRDQ